MQKIIIEKLMKIQIKNLSEFIPALEDCFIEMYIKRLDSLRLTITYKDQKYKTTLTNKTSIEAEYDNFVAVSYTHLTLPTILRV